MPLAQVAEAVATVGPGPKCSIALLRLSLDKADLEWLNSHLLSADTSSYIGDVLRGDKHQVGDQAIARHRRGKCSCESV